MTEIYITPYESLHGQKFQDSITINIRKIDFDNVSFVDSTSTYFFKLCTFRKLVVVCEETIDFQAISLDFFGCYIEDLLIENIKSLNVRTSIMGSIVGRGIIRDSPISLYLNNNLITSGFFITKIPTVNIAFSEKNLQLRRWVNLLRMLPIIHRNILETKKQSYFIYECQTIDYKTDLQDLSQAKRFEFHLSIRHGIEPTDKQTSIDNAPFKTLLIEGKPNGPVTIENILVESLFLDKFSPKSDASFFNINVSPMTDETPKVQIHQCNLDTAWFDHVNFRQFHIITLYRSKLSKTKFTSCSFPDTFTIFVPIENVHYPDRRPDTFYQDQYEMFLQLKTALEGTGNAYEANKFQALSLETLRKIKSLSYQDKTLLWLNNTSNKHGLSISRPAFWFLVLSIAMYLFYLRSLGKLYTGGKFDSTLVGYYFSFLDITHRNDFLVNKQDLTCWALTIDNVSKIVLGYLIYQFIAAFRKYSKKVPGQ
jgi:hypothetical protein